MRIPKACPHLWAVTDTKSKPKNMKTRTARENSRLNNIRTRGRDFKAAVARNLTPASEVIDLSGLAAKLGHVPDTAPAAKLAAEFARILNEWLTPAEMEAVSALNSFESDNVCATGDFCDSNMAMCAAFTATGVEFEPERPSHRDLWIAAWEIAKRMNFDTVLLNHYASTF